MQKCTNCDSSGFKLWSKGELTVTVSNFVLSVLRKTVWLGLVKINLIMGFVKINGVYDTIIEQ
jgi:hypothetical protein